MDKLRQRPVYDIVEKHHPLLELTHPIHQLTSSLSRIKTH